MKAHSKKSTANQRKEHNVEKYIHWVTTLASLTGLFSFVQQLLPPKSAKSSEILRKFELIAVQGYPKS